MGKSDVKSRRRRFFSIRVLLLLTGLGMAAGGVYVVVRDGSYVILPVILAGVALMVLGLAGSDKDLERLGAAAPAMLSWINRNDSGSPGGRGSEPGIGPVIEDISLPEKPEKVAAVSSSSTRSAGELALDIGASDADIQLGALEEAERAHGSLDEAGRRELLRAARAARPRGRTRGERKERRKRIDSLIVLLGARSA